MKTDLLTSLRECKFISAGIDAVRLDGTFAGYASLFNEVDLGNDTIRPGAFTASLARRGARGVRMLFQHDPGEPIGTWEALEETATGLAVRGRLALETARGREIHALLKAGALDGLSIGFRTLRARKDPVSGVRKILEADLWEISVVTFPMQESARVTSVKHASVRHAREQGKWKLGKWGPGNPGQGALPTIRQFERWLVQDAGLSRRDARLVIAKGYREAIGCREAADGTPQLAARIREAAAELQSISRKTR